MLSDEDTHSILKEKDAKIISLYLLGISVILSLISLYKDKATILDGKLGTRCATKYPDTSDFDLIVSTNRMIATAVFLYYSWVNLQKEADKQESNQELRSAYNLFYANILEFTGSSINLYNAYKFGESSFIS